MSANDKRFWITIKMLGAIFVDYFARPNPHSSSIIIIIGMLACTFHIVRDD